jgi:glutathione S-transferase
VSPVGRKKDVWHSLKILGLAREAHGLAKMSGGNMSSTRLRIYQTLAVEFQTARAEQIYFTNRRYVTNTPPLPPSHLFHPIPHPPLPLFPPFPLFDPTGDLVSPVAKLATFESQTAVFEMSEEQQQQPITVGYWSIRGLGAPLRMMVMYANHPLNNVMYDAVGIAGGNVDKSCWFSIKPEFIEKNPLMNLPYVIDGDNVITQSNACLSYLGRKLNLWGVNEIEVSQVEQLLCEVMDLRNQMIRYAYQVDGNALSLFDAVTGKNGSFQKFELWLQREVDGGRSGTFLVGDHATAPDFPLFEMLFQYTFLAEYKGRFDLLASFPRLQHYLTSFAALPANERYLATPFGSVSPNRLPFNNKQATFGAQPSGDPWVAGMIYEFGSYTGVF